MPTTSDDLARALVGLPGWRWRAGMRWICPDPTEWHREWDLTVGRVLGDEGILGPIGAPVGALPDLDDEATGGCLLAMVLALDPGASVESLGREPVIYVDTGDDSDTPCAGSTLARACAAALVAVGRCA